MSTEQHPTWDSKQTREAIEAYLKSDDGQRYQKLYSEGANAEDLSVFLRDAEHRLVCKTDRAKTWWQGIRECVGANHRHFLALAEPLCQLGKTPEDLYRVLSHQFQVDALVQAYRRCGFGHSNGLPPGITDSRGWSDDQIRKKLEEVKKTLDWNNTTGRPHKWWESFEYENKTKTNLVLRLAEELAIRKATITEFFLAYLDSNTDNIQANLSYLDYTRIRTEEEKNRESAAASSDGSPVPVPPSEPPKEAVLPPGITDTTGWTDQQFCTKLEQVKKDLDWDNTTDIAREWWEGFENKYQTKTNMVLRLAEELANRKATITEFVLAHMDSNTDNIQANLSYLDYSRLKKQEEKKKREAAAKALENRLEAPASPVSHQEVARSHDSQELTFIRCRSCRSLVPAAAKKCRICESPLAGSETSTQSETTVPSEPSDHANHASEAQRWERFRAIVVQQLGVSLEEVTEDASFMEDLGADSLDIVELIMAIEEEYDLEVPDKVAEKMHTVGDAFRYGIQSSSGDSRGA